jgi:hypothetical protein
MNKNLSNDLRIGEYKSPSNLVEFIEMDGDLKE